MTISRRNLLLGAAGTVALSTLPEFQSYAGVTNTILPNPIPQGGVNGETEVLCSAPVVLASGLCIAIGGSFDALELPNKTVVAAKNAAIIRISDHKVMWAGTGINNYVDTVFAINSVIYWGGRFTSFMGQSRKFLAAVSVNNTLLPWNPQPTHRVRQVAGYGTNIYAATEAAAYCFEDARSSRRGAVRWRKPTTTGRAHSLLVYNSSLYIGGLFESLAGRAERLVRLSLWTGTPHTSFNPPFRLDNYRGGDPNGFDGDCILSLAPYPGNRLLVGSGGRRNGMFILDSGTGKILSNSRWSYTPRPGSGATVLSSTPPNQAAMMRNSEGDVQAIAAVGTQILTGNHRGHVNSCKDWPTKRMLTAWYQENGRVTTGFDPGFWGGNSNTSKANGGVQTITVLPKVKTIVVGGCYKGVGDPYNDTGGADIYGAPGTYRAALTYLKYT